MIPLGRLSLRFPPEGNCLCAKPAQILQLINNVDKTFSKLLTLFYCNHPLQCCYVFLSRITLTNTAPPIRGVPSPSLGFNGLQAKPALLYKRWLYAGIFNKTRLHDYGLLHRFVQHRLRLRNESHSNGFC